jgi:twitching motility protein PilJ
MTSTPHDSQSPLPQQPKVHKKFLQTVLQLPGIKQLQLRSIGTQLFISVMAGAFIGIGGIALLFGEIVKFQAEGEIQQTLADKVHVIENTVDQAELLANSLRTSVLTLHSRQAKTPETYRQLTLELFENRPESVVGLGLGQSQNGILPEQSWFFSSFHVDSGSPDQMGQLLPSPNDKIRFVDGTQPDTFYPESDRYRDYFLPQKDVWSQPYQYGGQIQSTYYSQIFDDRDNWLGSVFVDLNGTSFNQVLDDPVFHQAGTFALLTQTGQIVSYPAVSSRENNSATYQSIPGLAAVWSEVSIGESGLIEGEHGYWAYAKIPETGWITVAFVPYRAIFNQVALITVGGTATAGLLLALIVILAIRAVNRRLRPILDVCHQLVAADEQTLALSEQQDEIGQVSVAFFNLLEQIQANEEKIRQEVSRTVRAEAQLQQIEKAELESQALQAEVEHILQVLTAIEHGDLTVEAQVSFQVTGLVADTLNRLIEQLGQMMAIVLTVAQQATQGSEDLEQLAAAVAGNIYQQTQSVKQVASLIENINKLSQDAALQAIATNEAVELTRSTIAQGQQKAKVMTKGITKLQQETDQIVKRTQTLTNYVELAAQFTKDQKRIAAMTRILAVNASMLASRASSQEDPQQLAVITREFETIAAQVNQLATQTNQSLVLLQQRTDQIQTVVSGLSHDVQEINQQVNTLTSGVNQSRQAFDTVTAVSERMAQMGQRMFQSSQTIAATAHTTLESIQSISAIAAETLNQADTTKEQAKRMEQLAHTLLHKVEFFRLQPSSHSVERGVKDEK